MNMFLVGVLCFFRTFVLIHNHINVLFIYLFKKSAGVLDLTTPPSPTPLSKLNTLDTLARSPGHILTHTNNVMLIRCFL